jgi:hypothetical protein
MKFQFDYVKLARKQKIILTQMLLLFGFILMTGFNARAERIEGTFQYARHDGSHRPIKFAKVEIWRFGDHGGGVVTMEKDAEVVTDANGHISKDLPSAGVGAIVSVKVFASNYAAVVWEKDTLGQQFWRFAHNSNSGIVFSIDETMNFDTSFDDEASSIHFNLADIARYGYDYANSHRDYREGDQIGKVNIQPQSLPLTYYNPVNDTIYTDNDHQFEDFSLLHEYGHYLEDQLSYFFAMPSTHDGCSATVAGVLVNSGEHAWMEGFADYFSQMVAKGLPAGTVKGQNGTIPLSMLETPPFCGVASADKVEFSVAASLWDLFDSLSASEPFDFINGQDRTVFQILDYELEHLGRAPTIWDFLNAWNGRGLDQAGINRILSHTRITPILPTQTSECLQMNAPSLMFPGQTYNVTVVMRNTGETTWSSAGNYFLGSQNPQDNNNFQRSRVPMPYAVPPGGQVTFNFTVTAPSTAGIFQLQFAMVQEWVEWFGAFTPTVTVEVRAMRLEVVPVSRTSTTETVRVNAYDYRTGAPVQGTVTSSVTSPAPTGTNITFTRPWVYDCYDGANGRTICTREYLQVVFTVTAPNYGSTSIWY